MQATTSPGRSPSDSVPFRCLMIGSMFDRLTSPQPVCVQGATGEMGMVPEVGSQPRSGYHADRLRASRSCALSTEKELPSAWVPLTSCFERDVGEAPEDGSSNSFRNDSRTKERMPAVRGVANEVPEVSW